jgi:hypothetical protein
MILNDDFKMNLRDIRCGHERWMELLLSCVGFFAIAVLCCRIVSLLLIH